MPALCPKHSTINCLANVRLMTGLGITGPTPVTTKHSFRFASKNEAVPVWQELAGLATCQKKQQHHHVGY
jgi:hypothetical protein